MTKKRCCGCGRKRDRADFYRNRRKPDGLQSSCKECSKERRKRYWRDGENRAQVYERKRERRAFLSQQVFDLLRKHKCVDCGLDDPEVLEFDHVRGRKIESVKRMVSVGFSWAAITEEIKKCDIRCANCHRKKTIKTLGWNKTLVL